MLFIKLLKILFFCFNFKMKLNPDQNLEQNLSDQSGRLNVSDLISRLNEEKKIEKKRNLALGVAAFSAVTVFGIILTI